MHGFQSLQIWFNNVLETGGGRNVEQKGEGSRQFRCVPSMATPLMEVSESKSPMADMSARASTELYQYKCTEMKSWAG